MNMNYSKDHKFHIGEGMEVFMKIDKQYFEPAFITQNGTYVVGVPITSGTMVVEARLRSIIDKSGKKIVFTQELSTTAELLIHTPVKVQPHILAIPWDVTNKSRQVYFGSLCDKESHHISPHFALFKDANFLYRLLKLITSKLRTCNSQIRPSCNFRAK